MDRVVSISDSLSLLMRDNIGLYRRHLKGTGEDGLIADTMLVTAYRGKHRPSLGDLGYRLRIERGASVEIIGADDLRDVEPAVAGDYHSAALVKEQARARDPGRLCKVLAAKAEASGAIFTMAEVTSLQPNEDGRTVLKTTDGEITAKTLVLAAGVWSADLLRPLGLKMPLFAERGYHLEFIEPDVMLNNSVQDPEAKVILSSMNNGLRGRRHGRVRPCGCAAGLSSRGDTGTIVEASLARPENRTKASLDGYSPLFPRQSARNRAAIALPEHRDGLRPRPSRSRHCASHSQACRSRHHGNSIQRGSFCYQPEPVLKTVTGKRSRKSV